MTVYSVNSGVNPAGRPTAARRRRGLGQVDQAVKALPPGQPTGLGGGKSIALGRPVAGGTPAGGAPITVPGALGRPVAGGAPAGGMVAPAGGQVALGQPGAAGAPAARGPAGGAPAALGQPGAAGARGPAGAAAAGGAPSTGALASRDPGAQGPTISERIAGIVDRGGPLMQMAETQAAKQMQRRGLGSSSIAVGAAQNEVFRAAAPIATAESQIASTEMLSRERNRLEEIMQTRQLTSTEKLQLRDIKNQQTMQGRDIGSRERMQGRDITSQQKMQNRQIGSTQQLAQAQRNLDRHLASLDRSTQTTIAGMNLDAADRGQIASLMANYSNTYESQIADINANENMSGSARANAIADLRARRASQFAMWSDLYDVDISWQGGEAPPPSDDWKNGKGKNK